MSAGDAAELEIAGVHLAGPAAGAPVLRIFGDYECPACRALEREAGDTLRSLAAAGRLTLIYHHAPLRTHWRGAVAAEVAYCAAIAGQGSAAHRALLQRTMEWSGASDPAADLLIAPSFPAPAADSVRACLRRGAVRDAVARDRRLAVALGVDAVPTLVLDGARLEFRSWAALVKHVTRRVVAPS